MNIYDVDGNHVGAVAEVTYPETGRDSSASENLLEPVQRDISVGGYVAPTTRMRETGHLRIDARGWFSRDIYVGTEHIQDIDDDRITLTVTKHVI